MKPSALFMIFLLLATGWIALAEQRTEEKLLASARSALAQHASTNDIVRAISDGLWNSNKTAIAIAIPKKPKGTLLFVFIRQTRGDYLAVDVSGIEGANVGFIGPSRSYERVESVPVKWLERDDGLFQILMRTRAWSSGKRYTSRGAPLIIRPDGGYWSQ